MADPVLRIESGQRVLKVGESLVMTATLTAAGGVPVLWSVREPDVASVESPYGSCGDRCALVTGRGAGATTIEATATVGSTQYGAIVVVTVLA